MTGTLVGVLECAVIYVVLLMRPLPERRRVTYLTQDGE